MAGKKWTKEEEDVVREMYPDTSAHKLMSMLPGRSIISIQKRAKLLGVVKRYGYSRAGSVSPLLEDTNEAFYWAGFIAADGSIQDHRRLKVAVSSVDLSHLKGLALFLGTTVNEFTHPNGRDYCYVSIRDSALMPRLCEKYDFKKAKTYNPPTLNIENDDLFLSFFAGFVDGDGSILNVLNRKDVNLKIKVHSSWLEVLSSMEHRIYNMFGFEYINLSKINNSGYAYLCISNNTLLRKIKERVIALVIPVLDRKWDKIDCSMVSRYEVAKENKSNVLALFEKGHKVSEIAKVLSLKYGTAFMIVKRAAHQKNI